ncbi:MAG: ABC transporter ATP-binding protein [Lachnospiraceae bacterium]|nr:ABC transporter ATP-binding protein [Lachnospiraceae bacterium]
MIEIKNVTKKFEDRPVVDHVNLEISEGNFFALIGTNGAGKSTLFRMMCGIYRPDEGEILIDGEPVYDHPEAKGKFFFIADEPYFFANATLKEMEKYYRTVYPNFDAAMFEDYAGKFGLELKRKINTFSKGMRKQAILLLGLAAKTKYLICDETFDGLDPVMRQGMKTLMAKEMEDREFTPILASHNLRETEDICDHVGLLHKGGVLLSKDLMDMKLNIQKVQCVFQEESQKETALADLEVMQEEKRGSLYTFTVRGTREEVTNCFAQVDTVFYEALPLSLEEIFISETEVVGYDVKKLILD